MYYWSEKYIPTIVDVTYIIIRGKALTLFHQTMSALILISYKRDIWWRNKVKMISKISSGILLLMEITYTLMQHYYTVPKDYKKSYVRRIRTTKKLGPSRPTIEFQDFQTDDFSNGKGDIIYT